MKQTAAPAHGRVFLMAAAGLVVASIHCNQPILALIEVGMPGGPPW